MRRNGTFILSVEFCSKLQCLPRLTLLLSNDECDSVASDALILGVVIAVLSEIVCVNVASSTLSCVV